MLRRHIPCPDRVRDGAILKAQVTRLLRLLGTLRSTTRQGRRRSRLQNVKKQCKFKLLKEVTVN